MNLNSILKSLDSCGYFGHILSTEEGIVLHNSLLILQNENHFRQIFFWGKILGVEKDYYIAYGYSRDILYGKVYYYSRNCTDWGLLPKPTKNGLVLTPLCTSKFQGDPSLVIDVLIDKDEILIPGKRKQPELRKLKEEDRLASTVYQIMDEAGVVPRGALFRRPDGIVVENSSFEGLSTLEAREIKSFLHFRPPTRKQNSNLLTRDDFNYAMDFLDPLDIDLPEGCWIIQITPAEDMAIVKSIHWPGLLSYHFCKTPKHGFIYFGHGKKSLDAPFMLSPFCM
ncbi:unnamed protein product [Phaedon cochleariae]|uniref:Radial spoke head protein 9 homolog n=1 Tax=Phaedon cochleariae TaxID=80249 RepID=A0A9N9SK22_PHACE|nr:unnamed protein product [Phaedon cochleariae]